jgi:hypothetical protein
MGLKSQFHHPFGNTRHPGTFSAWTMAIVFATVAMISFAIDQAISPSPSDAEQGDFEPPSLLHPVLLLESLIETASQPSDHVNDRRP